MSEPNEIERYVKPQSAGQPAKEAVESQQQSESGPTTQQGDNIRKPRVIRDWADI